MSYLYVDATSGGMVIQVLLSGLVGGVVVLKLFWGNIVNTVLFWRRPERRVEVESSDTERPAV